MLCLSSMVLLCQEQLAINNTIPDFRTAGWLPDEYTALVYTISNQLPNSRAPCWYEVCHASMRYEGDGL